MVYIINIIINFWTAINNYLLRPRLRPAIQLLIKVGPSRSHVSINNKQRSKLLMTHL